MRTSYYWSSIQITVYLHFFVCNFLFLFIIKRPQILLLVNSFSFYFNRLLLQSFWDKFWDGYIPGQCLGEKKKTTAKANLLVPAAHRSITWLILVSCGRTEWGRWGWDQENSEMSQQHVVMWPFVVVQIAAMTLWVKANLSSAWDWYLFLSTAQIHCSISTKPSPLWYKDSHAHGGLLTPGKMCSRAGK